MVFLTPIFVTNMPGYVIANKTAGSAELKYCSSFIAMKKNAFLPEKSNCTREN